MTRPADRLARPPEPEARARRNPLSPKKLLLTKWTAAAPRDKEKHFVVVRVVVPDPPATRIDQVELEAVHSRRIVVLPWRDLTDGRQWRQGWL
ncbi:TIGR02450 family Trp-rich protein [Ideonella sp. A 288]|uniref:TIGR02450 family Trp-rich protein n=1 Tax=Ideonella sp. A 288 TaxID=1962181 RepID=UPI000B4AFDE0|nr:TIGR02450 family Trp-rich protein [Ideonella sp. A 288]